MNNKRYHVEADGSIKKADVRLDATTISPVALGVTNVERTRGWAVPMETTAGDIVRVGDELIRVFADKSGHLWAEEVTN